MKYQDSSLRLRFLVSLMIFVSGYAPLLLILAIKDLLIVSNVPMPQHPWLFAAVLMLAVLSTVIVLTAIKSIHGGLVVEVTKASNKSGEMFGYTIPYALSFIKIDLGDWQTLASVALFLAMMFAIAYRTQTVFVNPILALAGYMQIDCTFKQGQTEVQAMVLSREPLKIGQTCRFERLSHYLYVAVFQEPDPTGV